VDREAGSGHRGWADVVIAAGTRTVRAAVAAVISGEGDVCTSKLVFLDRNGGASAGAVEIGHVFWTGCGAGGFQVQVASPAGLPFVASR
jgi:hypothetical protein